MLRKRITGAPFLIRSRCEGRDGMSIAFRASVGTSGYCSLGSRESELSDVMKGPGNWKDLAKIASEHDNFVAKRGLRGTNVAKCLVEGFDMESMYHWRLVPNDNDGHSNEICECGLFGNIECGSRGRIERSFEAGVKVQVHYRTVVLVTEGASLEGCQFPISGESHEQVYQLEDIAKAAGELCLDGSTSSVVSGMAIDMAGVGRMGMGGQGIGKGGQAMGMGNQGMIGQAMGNPSMGPSNLAGENMVASGSAPASLYGLVTCFISGKNRHYARNCWQVGNRPNTDDDNSRMREIFQKMSLREEEEGNRRQWESEEAKKEERREGEKIREEELREAKLEATILWILSQRRELVMIVAAPQTSNQTRKRSPRSKASMLQESAVIPPSPKMTTMK
ncbi:hypothetical protein CBR_g4348 [Chara braunii]|uniref:Uncharacterized protein n=1 Tax=Chara braunii TaxID=69332 RepID=A0A388JRJ5_CHABU|nr:hypothetical protein CBR_g4348 [Chara braunii]|eukprot:GBG60390.1 hypothetical protein CBR_g4348 [Chara braunii]